MKLRLLSLFCIALSAQASIVLTTPSGAATSGGAVSASASITLTPGSGTTAGSISVFLTNSQANPTDVSQTLSDFSLTLSNGFTLGATTSTPTGVTLVCIGTTGCSTTVKPWGLSASGNTITLEGLFGSTAIAPSQEIIGPPGPSGYTNANSSISGNGPHNPFISNTATFTFPISGLTAGTTVTGGVFSFGTTPEFVTAGGGGGGGGAVTPEPESLVLGLSGGMLLMAGRYLTRKPKQV